MMTQKNDSKIVRLLPIIKQTNNRQQVLKRQKRIDASLVRQVTPFKGKQLDKSGPLVTSDIVRELLKSFKLPSVDILYPGILSKREWEILVLLALGLKYQEIANSIGIEITSVNTYIRRIYKKLHVSSRSQAILVYLQSISH